MTRTSTSATGAGLFSNRPGRASSSVRAVVLLFSALIPAWSQSPDSSSSPRVIQSTEEILSDWKPDQRLYVKGELGLGAEQLGQLEQWLDQNGTNWIVVLMESATGETFTDAQGRRFNGMDAVEHRLGNGLPGRTSFGTWTDPRTGERNGAFFALFLKERKFSYYGSDAQDKHGLGEDRWVGRLDQPAIAAMRGGGRIIDAAKDTVTSINQQLARRIAAEERQRQEAVARAEARKVELQTRAGGLMDVARQNVSRLEAKILKMREAKPERTGSIVQPDFASWNAALASAKSNFDSGDFQAAMTLAESVNERVARASGELESYQNAGPLIAGLQSRLVDLGRSSRADQVGGLLESAERSLSEGQQAHASANPSYLESMTRTRETLDQAGTRIESLARRERVRRNDQMLSVAVGTVVLLLVGLVLNRRRRPSRREALELIEAWKRALDEKTVAASAVMGRSMNSLGASRTEAEARFAGETLTLVKQTIRDVDEMLIMATCAERVLKEAMMLARPGTVSRRAANLFFKRHYRAAIRRLRDEPVVFQPEEEIVAALRDKKTDRDRLLGDLESYQPFKLSFNELIANFNQRAERALASLDELEEGQLEIADLLVAVEQGLEKTRNDATTLENKNGPDVLFPITDTLTTLLPSAADAFSAAAVMSISDPLGALRTVGARAHEQADDARALVRLATDFHDQIKQEIVPVREELIHLSLATDWIDEVLRQLSGAFVGATRRAVQASTAEAIADIVTGLAAVVKRVGLTVKAEQFRVETVLPAIAETTGLVATSRARMGKQLGLDPGRILVEAGRDPDHFLKAAREQSEAARAASNRGDVEGANSASAQALHEAGLGRKLVDDTATAFAQHDDTVKARTAEANRLESAIPKHQTVLESIESRYAATVLLLGAGDSTHPDANGTVRDNLKESYHLMATATRYLQHAVDWFVRGRILDSADALERANGCQKLVELRLQEIRDKQERLAKTETANRSLLRLLCIRVDHLESQMKDNRTTRESQERFDRVQEVSKARVSDLGAPQGDPFKQAEALLALQNELDHCDSAVAADWELHAETVRSVDAAEGELKKLEKLEGRSAADRFPDSLSTQEIIRQARELRGRFAGIRERLGVPHGDWVLLDDHADDLARQAGLLAARLRNELAAAEKAYAEFQAAVKDVRSAGRWSGEYGVSVSSQYGADPLARARQGFQRGDYAAVLVAAVAARRMASHAIAEAQAEVRRRQQAEQARIEREQQQRRAAARRLMESSSSSSFGSSFGSSGFSSGSGSSRSSFSSGSGTSRSGW